MTRPWWLLPPGRINALWWLALGAAMLAIERFGGPTGQYPVVYAVPVALAAWYSGPVGVIGAGGVRAARALSCCSWRPAAHR
jgi:hypothetical protein